MPHTTSEPLVDLERRTLADDLVSYGPDAPTILDGWAASDLLEHLLLRERRQDLLVGQQIPIPALARRADAGRDRLVSQTWSQQVQAFRSGPPRLSPMRPLNRLVNTIEYAVHHEDLRRARRGWEPRALSPAHQHELWGFARRMAPMLVRAAVDVTLVSTEGGIRVPAKRRENGDSQGAVRVHGDPLELVLWAYGRDQVAEVEIEGDARALLALREADRGF